MVAWRVGCGSSEAAQCPPDERYSDKAGQEPVAQVGCWILTRPPDTGSTALTPTTPDPPDLAAARRRLVALTPNHVAELAAVLLPDKDADIVIYGAHRHSPAADAVGRNSSTSDIATSPSTRRQTGLG
jgi:hypothetical protein